MIVSYRIVSIGLVKQYFNNNKNASNNSGYLDNIAILPFVLYWLFFLFLSVTTTHVQTITRFFSACPPVYWFSASLLLPDQDATNASTLKSPYKSWKGKLVVLYFIMYTIIGVILFTNFYPWT